MNLRCEATGGSLVAFRVGGGGGTLSESLEEQTLRKKEVTGLKRR